MRFSVAFTLFLALAALLLLAALSVSAKAENEDRWVRQTIRKQYRACDHWGCRIVYRDVQVRHYRAPVYGYSRREDDERWETRDPQSERGVQCKDSGPVRVVGGKHLTQPGAIKDAVGRWESSIGYDFGEKFANMENARGYKWRCDKASTVETTIGRVGEGIANAVTGGNADAYYKRCVVLATPCMQPVLRGDRDGDHR